MPIATAFSALGKGNGFPFCVTQRSFDSTIHAGEYTLIEAMSLIWNLYTLSVSATLSNGESGTGEIEISNWFGSSSDSIEPMDRVCISNPGLGYDSSSNKYHLYLPELFWTFPVSFESSIRTGTNPFNVSSTDEATVSDTYGGQWRLKVGFPGDYTVTLASIDIDFYTYA